MGGFRYDHAPHVEGREPRVRVQCAQTLPQGGEIGRVGQGGCNGHRGSGMGRWTPTARLVVICLYKH
jgi:hypothetical protein